MKRPKSRGGFMVTWLIIMLIGLKWTIPACILLLIHFWLGWSMKWFWAALALWLLFTLIIAALTGWANKCSDIPAAPQRNKNPYSAKNSDVLPPEKK